MTQAERTLLLILAEIIARRCNEYELDEWNKITELMRQIEKEAREPHRG